MTHMNGINRRMRARTRLEQAGFSLAEAVVTVAVSMIGLGGVMMMNAQQLKLVSSTRESNAASWVLQDRLERLRNVSWEHLTNAGNLKTAMATLPDCAQLLPGCTERITLVKSNEAEVEGTEKLVIERGADGTMRTISTGASVSTGREVKVDVLVSWTSRGGRTRERSYTSVISDSGVSRTNVPGFGGPTGTTPVDNGNPSDGWTGDTTTPPTTEQPTEIPNSNGTNGDNSGGSTGTGGTTTGNTGSTNNGNGNGNGNGNSGGSTNTNNGNGNGNPHGNTNGQSGKK